MNSSLEQALTYLHSMLASTEMARHVKIRASVLISPTSHLLLTTTTGRGIMTLNIVSPCLIKSNYRAGLLSSTGTTLIIQLENRHSRNTS